METNGHTDTQPNQPYRAVPFDGGVPPPLFSEEQFRRLENSLILTANQAITSRLDWMQRTIDPRRNLENECGYPTLRAHIDAWYYQDLYDREAICARVVQFTPEESWQQPPTVYESEDEEEVTPFEEAWDALGAQLRGEGSFYVEEEGSPIWSYLKRVDILSGISRYGVVLLGLDDGKPMYQPVEGVEIEGETPILGPDLPEEMIGPSGKSPYYRGTTNEEREERGRLRERLVTNAGAGPRPYSITVNQKKTKGRKLLYLRVFPESLAEISQFEANENSPRFMQPVMYRITFNDQRNNTGGIGMPMATRDVHWTRVIHIADNVEHNEALGVPRMQSVLHRLLDLRKIYAAAGEGYWKNAFAGLSFETHPSLGGDVRVNKEDLKDQYERFIQGLDRVLLTKGLTVKTIAPAVVDPTPQINIMIEAICIAKGWPVRIFKGSERGELASSQDERSHKGRMRSRKFYYLSPSVIVPTVDRLILVGALPKPKFKEEKEVTAEGVDEVGKDQPAANPIPPGKGGAPPRPFGKKPPQRGSTPPSFGKRPASAFKVNTVIRYRRVLVRNLVEDPETGAVEEKLEEKVVPEQHTVVETPVGYKLDWPDLDSQTDKEKAEVAGLNTTTLTTYASAGGEQIMARMDFLTRVMKYTQEEAQEIIDNQEEVQVELDAQAEEEAQHQLEMAEAQGEAGGPPGGPPKPFGGPPRPGGPPKPFGKPGGPPGASKPPFGKGGA